MKELVRSSDPVRLSFLEALLADAGIDSIVLDRNVSATYLGALPARLMVDDEDWPQARRVLAEAGEPLDD